MSSVLRACESFYVCFMDRILFFVAGRPVALVEVMVFLALFGLALLLAMFLFVARQVRARRDDETAAEVQIAALLRSNAELAGRLQAMSETFSAQQGALSRAVGERLDGMSQRLAHGMVDTSQRTQEQLSRLHERLAVIDNAQKAIGDLTGHVGELQAILANKQSRGAFGEGRMQAILADALPPSAYALQKTLPSGGRPDCVIFLPNDAPPLVVDAKFPLEAYERLRIADSDTTRKAAESAFRRDLTTHIKAISERYLVPGETHDTAFMFVPSESVFAEIHEHFEELVQTAHRARVVIVSPSLLMLSVQVVQALLRDVRVREQAHAIQKEVRLLLDDVGRLADRVGKLRGHFDHASRDIDQIEISTGKITRRGNAVLALDVSEENSKEDPPTLASR